MNTQLWPAGAEVEKLAELGSWLEGCTWVPSRQSVMFSDVVGNRVWEYLPADDQAVVVEENAEFTNGRTLDIDGTIIECSHGRRALQRRDGDQVSMLVAGFGGVRFNSPNDVVVDSAGVIWFTDPAYGIETDEEGHRGEREYGDLWVFRYDPNTDEVSVAITDVVTPNGLAFSPDESLLYVTDTSGAQEGPGNHDAGLGHQIRVYRVIDGRRCKDGRTFVRIGAGVADGIRVDEQGRVWSSAGDGVHVFAPDGTELGFLPVPEVVANLCFAPSPDGGRDLYLCATTSLYRVRLS